VGPSCDGGGIGCSSTGLCLLNNEKMDIYFIFCFFPLLFLCFSFVKKV